MIKLLIGVRSVTHTIHTEPSVDASLLVTIATRSALVLADLMVIGVTWLALHRQYNGILGKHTLQYILMRDGQFCILTITTAPSDDTGRYCPIHVGHDLARCDIDRPFAQPVARLEHALPSVWCAFGKSRLGLRVDK